MQVPTPLSNLPTWVQVISMVGFPVVVAVFFLAKEVGYLPSTTEAQARSLDNLTRQHEGMGIQLDELIRLSREVCRNTAKDRWSENRCYPQ